MNDPTETDILANRQQRKYAPAVIIKRILWGLVWPFFRFSPRIFFAWRRLLLRAFGARVGQQVHIYNTACIYFPWNLDIGDWSSIGEHAYIYNLGQITIGKQVTISQRAHLCAGSHDYKDLTLPLIKPPICINDQAWICADAFIGPGVTVGEGTVVGARAVVVEDIDSWLVVAGNPARIIKKRELESS